MRRAHVGVLAFLQQPLCLRHREGALGRDRLAGSHGGGDELLGRKDAICESDAQRRLGVDRLAREHELLGPGDTDAAQQAARPAEAGDDPEVHFGLTEARAARRVDPVAGAGELTAAAEGVAVHRGDRRHRERLEGRERGVAQAAEGLGLERTVRLHLGDVGAGREGAALAGEHHGAHLAPLRQLAAAREQGFERRAIEGVQRLRPVEREHHHGAAILGADRIHPGPRFNSRVDPRRRGRRRRTPR